jgi:glycosyltransferase involved in cell wall biosynthesis
MKHMTATSKTFNPFNEPMSHVTERRILIFVVAYNAENTILGVLNRIPMELRGGNVEVLMIDDFSQDKTFSTGLVFEKKEADFKVTILRTPENQGYGGNQKLGYCYAIEHGFDIVALLHGDGQYAPEKLPLLLEPLFRNQADAVFGSRMLNKSDARKGGMPFYKWIGNQVLTEFENRMLGTHLSEFHSGYRLYSVNALRQIPFERNSNGFHFDTEIIVQFVMKNLRIMELPIPTYYGDEICRVNGLQYAWNIFKTMVRVKLHMKNLLYTRKFDVGPVEETYDLKLGYPSSHTMAIASVKPGVAVLDIGCGRGYVAEEMAKQAGHVTGVDQFAPENSPRGNVVYYKWNLDAERLPIDVSEFDQIFLLDIIEHLKNPEVFMETLRVATAGKRSEIVLTTANIGFFLTRLMLLFGQFNYGRQGILDRTHTRLFSMNAIRELLDQAGYKILEIKGIPAPFPKAIGDHFFSRALIALNQMLIFISKGLFAYQIFIRVQAQPTVLNLLQETKVNSEALKKSQAVDKASAGRGRELQSGNVELKT